MTRLLLKREQDLKVNLHSLTEEYQREKSDSDNNEIIEKYGKSINNAGN